MLSAGALSSRTPSPPPPGLQTQQTSNALGRLSSSQRPLSPASSTASSTGTGLDNELFDAFPSVPESLTPSSESQSTLDLSSAGYLSPAGYKQYSAIA